MKIRFLGTGTSTGVPQIGCGCEVCCSVDPKDRRLRSSVIVEVEGKRLLIDCAPDFRQQMLSLPFRKIDGLLLTHEHYDHVGGIDDLRPFSVFGKVDLYMEEHLKHVLRERMPYCFVEHTYRGVPNLSIHTINHIDPFCIGETEIVPIRVMHYRLPILGYRIGHFAYLTDVKTLPEASIEKLHGVDTLVISALRKSEHISHQTLDQALQTIEFIRPNSAYLTHLSHEMGLHRIVEKELPVNVHIAYDGLEISVK